MSATSVDERPAISAGQLADTDLKLIIGHLKGGRCVPFLGAGASLGSKEQGLPSGAELAREIAELINYPGEDKGDFLRVCQFYDFEMDIFGLRSLIAERLQSDRIAPGPVHVGLAKLPLHYVLTTNFDDLMERAFRDYGKKPFVDFYDVRGGRPSKLPSPRIERPIVYKLHGSREEVMSMLCSEDDVIQFIARLIEGEPKLPAAIKKLFSGYQSFVFIGYGLRDWNIRAMLRALRGPSSGRDALRSFAVQYRPNDSNDTGLRREWNNTSRYWDKKENITIVNAKAVDFVDALVKHCP